MNNNNKHCPLHKFDPLHWEPRTEEGKAAKRAYLEMLAQQKAEKIRAKDDAEKLAIAQRLIEEVEAKRRKQAANTPAPSNPDPLFDNNNDNPDHPFWKGW